MLLNWLRGLVAGADPNWSERGVQELTDLDALDGALAQSQEGPVAFFKHSTTCPISAGAAREVQDYLDGGGDPGAAFYLIKVIQARPVSNALAERLAVRHESPQCIVVRDGDVHGHASHGAITQQALREVLANT